VRGNEYRDTRLAFNMKNDYYSKDEATKESLDEKYA
jgi:hypothetical protein